MVVANELLDLARNVGQVGSRVEYEVLSSSLDVIGSITPFREPAPTITIDTRAKIIRSLRGLKLRADDWAAVNPFVDRVRPVWVLEDGTRWPLGACMFTNPQRIRGRQHDQYPVTLVDQTLVLDQPLTRPFGVPTNGRIYDAIVTLLGEVGFDDVDIEYTDQRVGPPANWPLTSLRTQVLDELTQLAGYHRVYFNNDGRPTVRPSVHASDEVDHVYDLGSTSRIKLAAPIVEERVPVDAPNVYIVVGTGPSSVPVFAKAYINPELPHSVENRGGFEVPRVIQMQAIQDTAQAQRIADATAAEDPFQLDRVSVTTPPDPRHGVFDSVRYDGERYVEVGWSMSLEPGADMTHEWTKVVSA